MTDSTTGGGKIPFDKASPAQKLYWDVLVNGKKIKPEQLPQSFSLSLDKLKNYLSEAEAGFDKLSTAVEKRFISIMPIAYEENDRVTVMLTPAVLTAEETLVNQFTQQQKKAAAKETGSTPVPPIDALNDTVNIP